MNLWELFGHAVGRCHSIGKRHDRDVCDVTCCVDYGAGFGDNLSRRCGSFLRSYRSACQIDAPQQYCQRHSEREVPDCNRRSSHGYARAGRERRQKLNNASGLGQNSNIGANFL